MSRSYTDRDLKLLFGKAGMYCAFPHCRARLLATATEKDDEAVLAYIAHIVAHSDTGPRADPNFPKELRDKYPNLVLMCGHHHRLVDAQDSEYTIEQLRAWKEELEAWVEERLSEGMRDIHFAELEVVCKAITNSSEGLASTSLTAVPPARKMAYNDLTSVTSYRMTLGLMQAPQVASFLQEMATKIDPQFPKRLRQGFVSEYEALRANDVTGDALFMALHDFASDGATSLSAGRDERFDLKSASLAVLCHLFEVCDVFEVPPDAAT